MADIDMSAYLAEPCRWIRPGLRPGEMKVVGGGFGLLLGLRGDGAMSCYGSAPWQRIGCGEHPSHEIRRHWVGMGRGDSTSATEAAVWIWWRLHTIR